MNDKASMKDYTKLMYQLRQKKKDHFVAHKIQLIHNAKHIKITLNNINRTEFLKKLVPDNKILLCRAEFTK